MKLQNTPSVNMGGLVEASESSPMSRMLSHGLFPAVLIAALYILAQYNYLAFHVLAEMFSIVVAAALFLLVWHGRAFIGNNSLVALAVAFFFAGVIDLLHTLTYQGMGVFEIKDQANAATQLWIAARWLESLSLLAFMWLRGRSIHPVAVLWAYAVATGLLLWCILGSRAFPDCFIEGSGLTAFKVGSEYVICAILACALVMLFRRREELDPRVQKLLAAGIIAAIVSELAFTFYVSVYGLSNLIGHIFKIAAFYLIYLALIRSSLTRPYQTLFRELTAARQGIERKATELDTILEATADGILAVDENGKVLHANERFRQLWGIPEELLRSSDDAGLLQFVLQQLKDPRAFQARVKALYESGEDEFTTLKFKDGRVFERLSGPLMRAGRVSGRVWSFRDVTERKQAEEALRESEEKLRLFIEHAPAAIAMLDNNMNYIAASRRWFTAYGVKDQDIIGRSHYEVFSDIPERWKETHRKVLAGGIERNEADPWLRADGRTDWVRWELRPWYKSDNAIGGMIIFSENITDRIEAEEKLRRLNESLEQQVAERTELAEARARQLHALAMELIEAEEQERRRIAELLHDDLQQTLAAVRMQLQTACESLPPESMLANVDRLIKESIDKSRSLSHELSPAVLHHSSLFSALEWLSRQMRDQFGLQVQLQSDLVQQFENAPVKVFLFRAVQELLFNVVKHAGVRNAQVVLSGSDTDLVLKVSDHGQGFNPNILDSTSEMVGFGLLSLRERARHMGGSLVIQSYPEQGSCFTLTVPIRRDSAD